MTFLETLAVTDQDVPSYEKIEWLIVLRQEGTSHSQTSMYRQRILNQLMRYIFSIAVVPRSVCCRLFSDWKPFNTET